MNSVRYQTPASTSEIILYLIISHIHSPNTTSFNGWGVTAVDSLDTMLMMDLQPEYNRAMSVVHNANFSLPTVRVTPFNILLLHP